MQPRNSDDRTAIITAEELARAPTDEALAIGRWLEANPPVGYGDRFSAIGWAIIAQAVLAARASIGEVR